MIPSSNGRVHLVNKFAIFSALLLIGASNSVHARNLRRIRNNRSSSTSSSIIDNIANEESRINNGPSNEPQSFELVGAPIEHDPFIPQDTTHRATMQREKAEVEEDESLVSLVSQLLLF